MSSDDEWAAPASDAEDAEVDAGSESDATDAGAGDDTSSGKKSTVKKGKGKPGGKKGGKEAKPKAKSKAKTVVCFAARCEEPKAGKSKFCERHRSYYQASQYQAERTGSMKIHNQVFSDPEKAASALLKLEKENPLAWGGA